jgi:hypothetical protein
MMADPSLKQKIKVWAGALNTASKKPEAPAFKMDGPRVMTVRGRKGQSLSLKFMGGEELRVSSVTLEQRMEVLAIEIRVILSPVVFSSDYSFLTLPLSEAIECIEGLSAWVDVAIIETDTAVAERKRIVAEVAKIPTVEETRASEVWGAW